MVDVAHFYNSVISDVINGMKDTFISEGVDTDLLEQLKKLWTTKLTETHVSDPEPVAPLALHYAQRLHADHQKHNMPIPIARQPIQSHNGLAGPLGVGFCHTAPLVRPNAPLNPSQAHGGMLIRGMAIQQQRQQPIQRQPVMLSAALSHHQSGHAIPIKPAPPPPPLPPPQQQQQHHGGLPMGGMTTINGITTLPGGQNMQLVQVGQQTFMVPIQFQPAAAFQHQHQQQANIITMQHHQQQPPQQQHHQMLQAPQQIQLTPQQHHQLQFQLQQQIQQQQQQQQQQQIFKQAQVDGVVAENSDYDDEDEEIDVLEPYSVDTSLRNHMAPAPTPTVDTTRRHLGDSEVDDDDDDDSDLVAANTPFVGGARLGSFRGGETLTTPSIGFYTPTNTPATKRRPEGGGGGVTTSVKRAAIGGGFQQLRALNSDEEEEEEDNEAGNFDEFGALTPAGQRLGLKPEHTEASGTEHIPDLPRPPEAALPNRRRPRPASDIATGGENKAEDPDLGTPNSAAANGEAKQAEDEEEEEEDDEPLNSSDDVSEDDLGGDGLGSPEEALFESANLVVCQYERVTRTRAKWRFWLRDGIMKVRGRDHLFQRLMVEADWLQNPCHQGQAHVGFM